MIQIQRTAIISHVISSKVDQINAQMRCHATAKHNTHPYCERRFSHSLYKEILITFAKHSDTPSIPFVWIWCLKRAGLFCLSNLKRSLVIWKWKISVVKTEFEKKLYWKRKLFDGAFVSSFLYFFYIMFLNCCIVTIAMGNGNTKHLSFQKSRLFLHN